MIPLNFSSADKVPTSTVLGKIQTWKLGPGVFPMNYQFLRVRGTSYIIGVPEDVAKQLTSEKDQTKLRKMMRPLVGAEVAAARANRPSPGKMLLIEQQGDAMRQVTTLQGTKETKGREKKASSFEALPPHIQAAVRKHDPDGPHDAGSVAEALREAHSYGTLSDADFWTPGLHEQVEALPGPPGGGSGPFWLQPRPPSPRNLPAAGMVGGIAGSAAGIGLGALAALALPAHVGRVPREVAPLAGGLLGIPLGAAAGVRAEQMRAAAPRPTGRPIPEPGSSEYGGPDTPVHAMKETMASISSAMFGGALGAGAGAAAGRAFSSSDPEQKKSRTIKGAITGGVTGALLGQQAGKVLGNRRAAAETAKAMDNHFTWHQKGWAKGGGAPPPPKPPGSISAHLSSAGQPKSKSQGGGVLALRDRMREQHIGQSARQNSVLTSGAEGDVWTQKAAAISPQAMQVLGRAGAGAAVGAAGGALVAGPEKRRQGALRGAMLGGAAGAATALPGVLGRSMGTAAPAPAAPRQIAAGGAPPVPPRAAAPAWRPPSAPAQRPTLALPGPGVARPAPAAAPARDINPAEWDIPRFAGRGPTVLPAGPPLHMPGPMADGGLNPAVWDIPRRAVAPRTGDMSQMLEDMALRKGASAKIAGLGGIAGAFGGAQGGSEHGMLSSGLGALVGHLVGDYVLPLVEEAILSAGPDFRPLAKPAALLASGVAGEISGRVVGGILQPHEPQETAA